MKRMTEIPDGGNGFTNKEILLAVWQEQRDGFADLNRLIDQRHADHESRIRLLEDLMPSHLRDRLLSLEHWRYAYGGAAALAAGVASFAAAHFL